VGAQAVGVFDAAAQHEIVVGIFGRESHAAARLWPGGDDLDVGRGQRLHHAMVHLEVNALMVGFARGPQFLHDP